MKKLIKIFDLTMSIIIAFLFIVMIILLFGQVVSRYLFNFPIMWAEEIGRYLFIWIVYIGASQAFLAENHLRVDFVVNKFPDIVKKYISLFLYLIILFFLFAVFLYGIRYSLMNFNKPAYSMAWFKIGWTYSAVPLGSFFMIINIIRIIPKALSRTN